MHEVLVNRLGGLSLPRKSVVRLTDRPDMTLDVYRGRKTTMQQKQQLFQYMLYTWIQNCTLIESFLSSPLAGKRDLVVTILFGVCACVRPDLSGP